MKIVFILSILAVLSGCPRSIGSSGTYGDIYGKAIIAEIKPVNNFTCPNAVEVFFNFIPDNPDASKNYAYPSIADTNIATYSNYQPSKTWVDRKGLKVGNTYEAKRSEMNAGSGTSTPVIFSLSDRNLYPVPGEDICK